MRAVVDISALDTFTSSAGKVSDGLLEPLTAWRAYERRHAGLFDRYFAGWGDATRRPTAAAQMIQTAQRLAAAEIDWERQVSQVAARMTVLIPRDDVEVPVVVFVGMGSSNGWVTSLSGRPTVFVAAELVAPPPFDAVLTAHELTHAAQHLLDPAWEASDYPLGAHALAEGLATHASALAYPGHGDDEYLWLDSAHAEWLQHCERAWPTAAAALEKVLDDACGGSAERRFFAARPAREDDTVPIRFGYYAGWRIVRDLAQEMTVEDLLTLDIATAQRLVRQRLRAS